VSSFHFADDFAIPFPAAYGCLGQEQTPTVPTQWLEVSCN